MSNEEDVGHKHEPEPEPSTTKARAATKLSNCCFAPKHWRVSP